MSLPIRNMSPNLGPMPTHLLVQQFCTTQQFALIMTYYQLDLLSVLIHTVKLIFQLYLEYIGLVIRGPEKSLHFFPNLTS